jgi:hypothetical protein
MCFSLMLLIYYIPSMTLPARSRASNSPEGSSGGQLDFVQLLDTPKGATLATKWMIQSGRIHQFQLAGSLLYKEDE